MASVDVFVVDVTEVDAPPGVEPLHWRLLTTHAVTTVAEAQEIVRWYRLRWTIDIDQAWRLSRTNGWVGSTCNEAFLVEQHGSVFSPVQIHVADRQAIAGQQVRATPA